MRDGKGIEIDGGRESTAHREFLSAEGDMAFESVSSWVDVGARGASLPFVHSIRF